MINLGANCPGTATKAAPRSISAARSPRLCRIILPLLLLTSVAPALADSTSDDTPWLGVAILPGDSGVLIREVIRDTPADEAGLRVGDEILVIADTRVATPADLKAVVSKHRIGEQVQLTVWRGGKLIHTPTTVGARMSADEILYRRLVGERAPDFDVDILYGPDSGTSSDLARRVVILQFFALICDDCIDQHRALSRLTEQHPKTDLAVVAIGIDSAPALEAWAAHSEPSFNVACDPTRTVFRDYRIETSGPALVVIDRAGRVVYAGVGGAANTERATLAAERALRRRSRD